MITGRQRSFGIRQASLIWAILFGCAFPVCALAQQKVAAIPPVAEAPVPDVTESSESVHTKFVVGLERPVEFQVFTLTHPNRVFVELPDLRLQLPALGMKTPVFTNQGPKGGALRKNIEEHGASRALIIDDIAGHPRSAAEHIPTVRRLHFCGEPELSPHVPCAHKAGDAHARIDNWAEALPWIMTQLHGDES